jgi:hypothetical protein
LHEVIACTFDLRKLVKRSRSGIQYTAHCELLTVKIVKNFYKRDRESSVAAAQVLVIQAKSHFGAVFA